jgi:hypothetical protein
MELNIYAGHTPRDVQPYMKQYAEKGHGTYWSGITKGLNHYGLKNVKQHSSMTTFWAELDKGDRIGVLLFGNSAAPDGRIFTLGGHYIAFTGYKKDNNRHYLFLKDSGGRNNSGWICYETSIKGTLKQMWTCEVPEQKINLPSRGYIQKGDSGPSVKAIQRGLKELGYYKGKIGGHYKTLTRRAVMKFQKRYGLTADGLFGAKTLEKFVEVIG